MTVNKNLIDVGNFKELNAVKKREDCYQTYIKTLGHTQLETEVNHLFTSLTDESQKLELVSKGKLLMGELMNRAGGEMKSQIESLNRRIPNIYEI